MLTYEGIWERAWYTVRVQQTFDTVLPRVAALNEDSHVSELGLVCM